MSSLRSICLAFILCTFLVSVFAGESNSDSILVIGNGGGSPLVKVNSGKKGKGGKVVVIGGGGHGGGHSKGHDEGHESHGHGFGYAPMYGHGHGFGHFGFYG